MGFVGHPRIPAAARSQRTEVARHQRVGGCNHSPDTGTDAHTDTLPDSYTDSYTDSDAGSHALAYSDANSHTHSGTGVGSGRFCAIVRHDVSSKTRVIHRLGKKRSRDIERHGAAFGHDPQCVHRCRLGDPPHPRQLQGDIPRSKRCGHVHRNNHDLRAVKENGLE